MYTGSSLHISFLLFALLSTDRVRIVKRVDKKIMSALRGKKRAYFIYHCDIQNERMDEDGIQFYFFV